jgi:hypothetical protein
MEGGWQQRRVLGQWAWPHSLQQNCRPGQEGVEGPHARWWLGNPSAFRWLEAQPVRSSPQLLSPLRGGNHRH